MWTWFLGTKVGRALLAAAGVLLALLGVYLKGRSDQKVDDKLKTVKETEEARKIENEVDSLDHNALVDSASKWVRK